MAAHMSDVILGKFHYSDEIPNIFLRLIPTMAKGNLSIIYDSSVTQV